MVESVEQLVEFVYANHEVATQWGYDQWQEAMKEYNKFRKREKALIYRAFNDDPGIVTEPVNPGEFFRNDEDRNPFQWADELEWVFKGLKAFNDRYHDTDYYKARVISDLLFHVGEVYKVHCQGMNSANLIAEYDVRMDTEKFEERMVRSILWGL